jgi:YVTN family beta-propeller protein
MKTRQTTAATAKSAAWTSALLMLAVTSAGFRGGCPGRHWAVLTAPVYDSSETGPYAGAELFAGPAKFGSAYHAGVLPNGRIVKPAGVSIQIGMNPLGAALTPDGKYLVTTNDDERDGGLASPQSPTNVGGYSISVVDTATMALASETHTAGKFFVGIQATGTGPYTLYVSGGPDNNVKVFSISAAGAISQAPTATIPIGVVTPGNAGYVSHYTPNAAFNTPDASGNKPPVPTGFSRTGTTAVSFPAGLALSPDGKYLYVACNGDNSIAVIDTTSNQLVRQLPVGFFPYGISVSADGKSVFVTNWGMTEYKFRSPSYDPGTGALKSIAPTGPNQPDGFYVPEADTTPGRARTSSASVISIPNGDPTQASVAGAHYLGLPLDPLYQVGDTHPSATTLVGGMLYVTKSNDDSIAIIAPDESQVEDFDLSLHLGELGDRAVRLRGAYPNALAVSHDGARTYVAEAGINSVAVLDTRKPRSPRLLGRIPTGWYPTALALSPDDRTLFVINAKGVGEDLNSKTVPGAGTEPSGVESYTDGNFIFGTAQKVDLASLKLDDSTVLSYNFSKQEDLDASVVPLGGERSSKIAHVVFILHENKTFDSMLGSVSHFGPFASTTFNNPDGSPTTDAQYTGVAVNTQLLAKAFATAVNYYSDSEESDAGHQFCASGTATDYTEKTLLVKSGRGLLVNKNFEPEDYPASGYVFNNAARNGVSFKDYGAMIRIAGTDTGTSTPTALNDSPSGKAGYPSNNTPSSPNDVGDVTRPTQGLGQSYFMALPVLAVLGGNNASGEPRIDRNYPGYNFNISDQRRALEFIQDFDRMVAAGTVPQFLYIYQPNDHTGSQQATNVPAATPAQQVADGDVALGMVVQHIMRSPIYYDAKSGTGTAIFITYDDAQSTSDHIHEHRTPAIVVSPFAKPGYVAKRHYSTASIVKTEELLLGLPPNNLGDLFATDMRDMFQPTYNGITADQVAFNVTVAYQASPEGRRIWQLARRLDTSAPDRDSRRLGALARLSMEADGLHAKAEQRHALATRLYRQHQNELLARAERLVASPRRDADD